MINGGESSLMKKKEKNWMDDQKFMKRVTTELERISPIGFVLIKMGKWYLDQGYKNEGFTRVGLDRVHEDLFKNGKDK